MTNENTLPPRLQEIIEDFQDSERAEKVELLIDYAQNLPPLPASLTNDRDAMEPVPECMTPVFIAAETHAGRMTFHLDVPPESPTVRGYAAILQQGMNGATPQQVIATPGDFYLQMGLEQVLTQQRLNGIAAILAHMKRLAFQALQP